MTLLIVVSVIIIGILAFFGTWISLKLATKYGIVDNPQSAPHRKLQKIPIPLMGATGSIIVATLSTSLIWLALKFDWFNLRDTLILGLYKPVSMLWVIASIFLLMLAGYLDDANKISNKWRFLLVGIALLLTVFPGSLSINALSFPFDRILPDIIFLPQILAFVWIGFCLFATKVLDGHDGLVTSVGIIGFLTISSVSLFPQVNQPLIYILGLVWATSLLGFLPFNFPNARLYLGDGGSMIIGYMIGVLSIMAGAKIATSSAVIGWFIIDIMFVWFRRVLDGRNPLTSGDRFHWHQRLVDSGLNKIQVLALTVGILLITSSVGLMANTEYKLFIIAGQGCFLLILFVCTYSITEKRKIKSSEGQF